MIIAHLMNAPQNYVDHPSQIALHIAADVGIVNIISGIALTIFGAITANPIMLGIGVATLISGIIMTAVCIPIMYRQKAEVDQMKNKIDQSKNEILETFEHSVLPLASQILDNLAKAQEDLRKDIEENRLSAEEIAEKSAAIEKMKQTIRFKAIPSIEESIQGLRKINLFSEKLRAACNALQQRHFMLLAQ